MSARLLSVVALLMALGVTAFGGGSVAGRSPVAGVGDPIEGRTLYVQSCATCHGDDGGGTEHAPSLIGVGAASADFQLRTGRMPLQDPEAATRRKPPAFSEQQINDLVAYVATLGTGPGIPEVHYENADLSVGADLFLENCAACHGSTANGGAVGGRAFAPSLYISEPLDIAEAIIVGPGEMPRFGFPDEERDAIVRYVVYLQESDAPGGLDIGGVGPVPEGFVAWTVGTVALVGICVFVGTTGRRRRGSGS